MNPSDHNGRTEKDGERQLFWSCPPHLSKILRILLIPTPPLTQHFVLDKNLVLMFG